MTHAASGGSHLTRLLPRPVLSAVLAAAWVLAFNRLSLAVLAGAVLWDVLVANVRVAALVLGPRRNLRPALFEVPLDVRDPFVIALLAAIVSLTPGTVSADHDPVRGTLLVHGLAVHDADHEVRRIKARYERALRAVFDAMTRPPRRAGAVRA
ncbi:MAG: Na+/H+ antiporter subunit E [Gemmatimonadaceae bacterium]|nr:Na+/H+ antiporter subunit E [Gemmatimonadaceae bacterium]